MALGTKLATLTRSTALALGVAFAATLATGFASTDALVERSFSAALDRPAADPRHPERGVAQIAGSEDFWLSQAANAETQGAISLALWSAPVKLGATVDITVAGQSHTLEIIDIAELPAALTRVGTAAASATANLVIVSLRDAGKPEGAIVRLVVEAAPAGGKPGSKEIAVIRPRAL